MTLRDRELPELLVIVASRADAVALSPLATMQDAVRATLVATGPDPMLVDEALDELDTPAGRILLPELGDDERSPATELAGLLPRLENLVAQADTAAVVVRGGTSTALAGAQIAVWRRLPLIALDAPPGSRTDAANQSMIAQLAAWQSTEMGGTVFPAWLDLVVHQRVATSSPADSVVGITPGHAGPSIAPGLSA